MRRFWQRALAFWLGIGFCMRLVFLAFYPEHATPEPLGGLLIGVINDLLVYPLFAGLMALGWHLGRKTFVTAVAIALGVAVIICVAEVFFWLEFESRLDRLVFHYLAYPHEVLVFLEDQFFLSVFVVPFIGLVAGLFWLLRPPAGAAQDTAGVWVFPLLAVGVLGFVSPVGQSIGRVANEFASNGYFGVLQDARFREADVAFLAGASVAQERFGVESAAQTYALQRAQIARAKHVVLIIEESFAGPVWRDADSAARYLPEYLALADRSVVFDNLFSSGSRTTRGMEAILNGFMPLPGISTTERSGFERLPSLAHTLHTGGFWPVFLYGGWPGFSNFSNYWRAAGFRQIWSRDDFNEDFETSWGVADRALFARILHEMDLLVAQRERVFLATLTVSHHRPYDFPAGMIDLPGDARESAFAMAYADASLGWFFEQARQHDWFADTLFVVVADHGLRATGPGLIPVDSYRIPMLFYMQGITPARITSLGSSVSLPFTLTRLLGMAGAEQFYGDDLMGGRDTLVPLEYGYHIGLLNRERLDVVTAAQDCISWRYDIERGLGGIADVGRLKDGCAAGKDIVARFAPAYQEFYSPSR